MSPGRFGHACRVLHLLQGFMEDLGGLQEKQNLPVLFFLTPLPLLPLLFVVSYVIL